MKFFSSPFFLVIVITLSFSSCKLVRPNFLLKTPKNYQFDKLNDSMTIQDYKIGLADLLKISISPNDGFSKVQFSNVQESGAASNSKGSNDFLEAIVGNDGNIKLPLIGSLSALGKTTKEFEVEIEKKFENYYIKPFATVQVINNRVVVYTGGGGNPAKSLPLIDNKTTLFEILAQAGGIFNDGMAYKIKLIRTAGIKTQVFQIDLSTINNLKEGYIFVMPNDIIYVEPRKRIGQKIIQELAPYLTLLSTSLVFYSVFFRK